MGPPAIIWRYVANYVNDDDDDDNIIEIVSVCLLLINSKDQSPS